MGQRNASAYSPAACQKGCLSDKGAACGFLPLPFRGEGRGEGNEEPQFLRVPSPAFATLGTLSPEGERECRHSSQDTPQTVSPKPHPPQKPSYFPQPPPIAAVLHRPNLPTPSAFFETSNRFPRRPRAPRHSRAYGVNFGAKPTLFRHSLRRNQLLRDSQAPILYRPAQQAPSGVFRPRQLVKGICPS